jgi:hypothetical protein
MERPDSVLQALRPALHLPETPEANSVEHFQNTVLRPIIKFQHHLIVRLVTQHPGYVTAKLEVLTDAQFLQAIRVLLQSNIPLRNQLIGAVLGLFTIPEFEVYSLHSTELNRRIIQMIAQRVSDSVRV